MRWGLLSMRWGLLRRVLEANLRILKALRDLGVLKQLHMDQVLHLRLKPSTPLLQIKPLLLQSNATRFLHSRAPRFPLWRALGMAHGPWQHPTTDQMTLFISTRSCSLIPRETWSAYCK